MEEQILEMYASDSDEVDLFSSSDDSSSENEGHAKIVNFIETIEMYSENDFKSHFRLRRSTVLLIIDKYKAVNQVTSGRPKVDAKIDIYMFLWYVSNTVTFRQLGNLFGVAKSTAWNIIVRVSNFFLEIGKDYLKWPSHEESKVTSKLFERIRRIPNVIGAIDGTHLKIKAPKEHRRDYCDRKKNFSISMQMIVDANKKFIDVSVGEPGSLHDGRVLRRSDIFKCCEENMNDFFPTNTFILGDSAYPVRPWLVPPFKDNGSLIDSHHTFNKIHSSTRVIVENAFALLKGRFRRILHFSEQIDLKLLTKIVYASCVLHNMCIMFDDDFDDYSDDDSDTDEIINQSEPEDTDEEQDSEVNETLQNSDRRQALYEELLNKNII